MTEKILPYDRAVTPQDTYYWCGPASCQVVLNSRGIVVSESQLARELGTTTAGTNWIGQITSVLNKRLGGGWVTRELPSDPPTQAQRTKLWDDIVRSINAGYGVVCNIVAPSTNYPRGVNGSVSPAYSGGDVYHYFTVMGYNDAARAVWVADSGFRPFGYWCSFDQLATLIPPKGYSCKPVGAATVEQDVDVKTVTEFIADYFGPLGSDVKDVREQLCGARSRDAGQYGGWPQLDDMTLVDALADTRERLVKAGQ